MRLQLCIGIATSLVAAAWLAGGGQSTRADYVVRTETPVVQVVHMTPVDQAQARLAERLACERRFGGLGPEEYLLLTDKLKRIDFQKRQLIGAQGGLTGTDQLVLIGKLNTLEDKLNMELKDRSFISGTQLRYWY